MLRNRNMRFEIGSLNKYVHFDETINLFRPWIEPTRRLAHSTFFNGWSRMLYTILVLKL